MSARLNFSATPDVLTALRCRPGYRATKYIVATEDGLDVQGYKAGKWFTAASLPVSNLAELSKAVELVSSDPRCFLIRGELLPGVDATNCRRLLHQQTDGAKPCFGTRARPYVFLDFDTVDDPGTWDWREGQRSGGYLRSLLPAEFHGVRCWAQFTSGAGFKPGLRMRLAFWLSRAVTDEELGRWLADAPVDHAIFSPVQPIYVAHPILAGVGDPVPTRSGIVAGDADAVEVPDLTLKALPTLDPMPGERSPNVISVPAGTYEIDWPFKLLEEIAQAVASTPPAGRNKWGGGGRHNALYCAALRLSRPIGEGYLAGKDVVRVLAVAAQKAGLGDAEEIARTIRNGFRTGGLSA